MDNGFLPETKTLVYSIPLEVKVRKSYVLSVPDERAHPKKIFPPVLQLLQN